MAEQALRRAFVVGWPITHSRSPIIHNHWIKQLGLDGNYTKHACEPSDFATFIDRFFEDGFVGGNVTLPFKEEAFSLADETDNVARAIGAANTIWTEGGKLHATNTDAYGFLANLDQQAPNWDAPEKADRGALVLGAGGAARAIVYGLIERGFSPVIIANRTVAKAQSLAEQFGDSCVAADISELPPEATRVGLLVNTTSVGMGDGRLPIDPSRLAPDTLVNDIVYAPLMTPLLLTAKSAGMPVADGLGMLLHQAVPGFERWFGIRPQVTAELRELVLADIGESV